MRGIFIILSLIISSVCTAQQLTLGSQYMLNQYMVNPAAAGQHKESPIAFSAKQQWAGLQGSPSTQFISYNGRIGKKNRMAIGTQLFNDKNGAFQQIGWQGTYAYHLLLSVNTKLSFGASANLSQTVVDGSNFILNDYSDETLLATKQKSFNPDCSAGVFYWGPNFFVGVSAVQLLQAKYTFGESIIENRHVNHIYSSGGVKFMLGNGFKIQPSYLVKMAGPAPLDLDINARLFYRENVWAGVSYRNSGATILMIGLERDRFLIGYAHDFTTSNIKNYSVGSNEIYFQYSFKSRHHSATKF